MPRLLEKTKKVRHKRFLTALERTGSPGKAAMETLNIGSRGAENMEASAAAAGTQMLNRIKGSMIEALERKGVTTDKIAERTNDLLDSQDPQYIDKGISQAMKMGLGGGYTPEKSINLNIEADASPEIKALAAKLNELYRS